MIHSRVALNKSEIPVQHPQKGENEVLFAKKCQPTAAPSPSAVSTYIRASQETTLDMRSTSGDNSCGGEESERQRSVKESLQILPESPVVGKWYKVVERDSGAPETDTPTR